jgi:nucleoside-diphosphate-sugar epimerase
MSVIAVTGAAGFVGRRVVTALRARGHSVIAIDRAVASSESEDGVARVTADLLDPPAYAPSLAGVECVIHLAAMTGKAPPEIFRRINVDATKAVLDASAAAGAKRFILMSSIAVVFPARQHYPYADSKIAAEALVRAGPTPWTILRPTMIMGAGSPIQASLERLARLPATPVFGDGRRRIEPVDVEDVATLLAALAEDPAAVGATIEIGGPEAMTMRDLLSRLRATAGASGRPRFLHAPLGLTRSVLAAIEGPALSILPFTAGQLATFANDSVASPHPLVAKHLPSKRPSPTPAAA